MKIIWLSHFYPYPPAGGALQRSYHLIRQIAQSCDVHLISLRKDSEFPASDGLRAHYPDPSEFCQTVTTFRIPSEQSILRRLLLLASGLWDADPYDDRWLQSDEMRAFLSSEIGSADADLVHLDTIGLAQYSRFFPNTPIAMNHHNVESHMMARRAASARSLLKSVYFRTEATKLARWERVWCDRFAQNLVVSPLDGERLEELVPDVRWETIPNGVDTEYFQPRSHRGEVRHGLTFVGRMSWYPNRDAIEWLLDEIWPRLLADDGSRTLTLVGSSPPQRAREAGEAENIVTTGFVDDVRPYLNRAMIFICPIRTGGGTRLKILDAMAMGMPIVATGMSVEGLDLEDGVHFLRADSPPEFVEQVGRLEADDGLRSRLTVSAREEAVRRFSWSRIGRKLQRVYRSLVA